MKFNNVNYPSGRGATLLVYGMTGFLPTTYCIYRPFTTSRFGARSRGAIKGVLEMNTWRIRGKYPGTVLMLRYHHLMFRVNHVEFDETSC